MFQSPTSCCTHSPGPRGTVQCDSSIECRSFAHAGPKSWPVCCLFTSSMPHKCVWRQTRNCPGIRQRRIAPHRTRTSSITSEEVDLHPSEPSRGRPLSGGALFPSEGSSKESSRRRASSSQKLRKKQARDTADRVSTPAFIWHSAAERAMPGRRSPGAGSAKTRNFEEGPQAPQNASNQLTQPPHRTHHPPHRSLHRHHACRQTLPDAQLTPRAPSYLSLVSSCPAIVVLGKPGEKGGDI